MKRGDSDFQKMALEKLNDMLGPGDVQFRSGRSSDDSNYDVNESIGTNTPAKAFSENAVLKHLHVGTKDLVNDYEVNDFLDDENVVALTEYEYSVLTNQTVEKSRAELNLINVVDSPSVTGWSSENQEFRTIKLQNAIETATKGNPTFLIVADGRHFVNVGLIADRSAPDVIQVVYMNSAYGIGGEKYIFSKITGLDLICELIGMIGQTDNPNKSASKLQAQVYQIYLDPTQQLANNCGVITALNIASLAKYWKGKKGKKLDFNEYGNGLKKLNHNVILSCSDEKERVAQFENYIRSIFSAIKDLEIDCTPIDHNLLAANNSISFTVKQLNIEQVQSLKAELEAQDSSKLGDEELLRKDNKLDTEVSDEAFFGTNKRRSQFTDLPPVPTVNRRKGVMQSAAGIKESKKKINVKSEQVAKCISFEKKGKRTHVKCVEFSQAEHILIKMPILANFSSWLGIPQFVVITGKNGAGKSQLLGYIDKVLRHNHSEINAFFRDTSDRQYNAGDDSTGRNLEYFQDGVPMKQLIDAAREYCKDRRYISPHLNKGRIYQDLMKKIDSDPKFSNFKDSRWQSIIEKYIKSYQDYESEKHDLKNPINVLSKVFRLFVKRVKKHHERLKDLTYLETLLKFYCEKNKLNLEDVSSYKEFYKEISDVARLDALIDGYIKVELEYFPPWEEINKVLLHYGFKYEVKWEAGNGGRKELVFKRGVTEIEYLSLSSGEKVALDLMAWQYYYQGLSAVDGQEIAEVKRVDIMLLDEPDSHLDPELCKTLYRIIYEEFVQKHNIQVIMTTHRIDTVALAPAESIYIMEGGGLITDKEAAFKRMESNINPAVSKRGAISTLTDGKLTVVEDVNYVMVENKDDAKFYSMVQEKFLKSSFLSSHVTKLIFTPVGGRLVNKEDLNRLSELVTNVSKAYSANKDVKEMSAIIKSLKGVNDDKGGCSQVIQKAEIEKYEMIANDLGIIAETPKENNKHRPHMIWGLLDRDKLRVSENNIYAIDVYSFECYLCMPLNLFYLMKKNEEIVHPELKNFKNKSDLLENLLRGNKNKPFLQNFLKFLTRYVIKTLNKLITSRLSEQGAPKDKLTLLQTGLSGPTRPLILANDMKVGCPEVFFKGIAGGRNGHKLEDTIGYVMYGGQNYIDQMHTRIFGALEKVPAALLPKSLLTTMKQLVNSKNADAQKSLAK